MIRADHGPHQGYSSFLPVNGVPNAGLSLLARAMGPSASDVARAHFVNMAASWVCLILLSWCVHLFLGAVPLRTPPAG